MKNLIDYAMTFVGTPYIWGGDEPLVGFDCSGFVQEVLSSIGADPPGDQTSQTLYNHFAHDGLIIDKPMQGSVVFFGRGEDMVTHVALCIDSHRMIEAGGGNRQCKNRQDAITYNAFVRVRPIKSRRDLVAIINPYYFS